VTRTRRVRLTLVDPPTDYRLGSTVTATRKAHIVPTIELPLSALLEQEGKASVWVVDEPSSTVNLRDIQLASKGSRSFVVAGGLDAGMRVVTAGVHSLTPGQKVKISQEAPL
jgi:multidrug efflux pump subunit AcrA (membrane-fusion protein)